MELLHSSDSRRKHRILVVDDYLDIAEIICSQLEILGQESRMASTGRDALEEASRFDPEIVILDLALPDISGLEVARALRSRAAGRPLYIAALTARTQARAHEEAFAAGCDQCIVKPGNLGALLETAVQRLSNAEMRSASR